GWSIPWNDDGASTAFLAHDAVVEFDRHGALGMGAIILGASHPDTGRIGCSGFYWLNQFRRESRWILWPVDRRHPFVERILLFAYDLFFVCRFRFGCDTDFGYPDSRQRFKTQPELHRQMRKA